MAQSAWHVQTVLRTPSQLPHNFQLFSSRNLIRTDHSSAQGSQCIPKPTISTAQIINALVVLTTIHAPDFEDAAGDRLDGRLTLPVVYPRGSRIAITAVLLGWSAFLVRYWAAGSVCAMALLGLGTAAGVRFLMCDSARADHTSFRLYTVRARTKRLGFQSLNLLPCEPWCCVAS